MVILTCNRPSVFNWRRSEVQILGSNLGHSEFNIVEELRSLLLALGSVTRAWDLNIIRLYCKFNIIRCQKNKVLRRMLFRWWGKKKNRYLKIFSRARQIFERDGEF